MQYLRVMYLINRAAPFPLRFVISFNIKQDFTIKDRSDIRHQMNKITLNVFCFFRENQKSPIGKWKTMGVTE
jgi:hypothetical protein